MEIMQEERVKYSKFLSSLFCCCSIVTLTVLSLLNHLIIDLYTMYVLLKVVLPAAFCFWFIGFVIGKILDKYNTQIVEKTIKTEQQAYTIPSIFAGEETIGDIEEDFGEL